VKIGAIDFLLEATKALEDRAATRDEGQDRSISRAVRLFAELTGIKLTEVQGCQFMVCLKLARGEQGEFEPDDYVDLAGYAALTGEAAAKQREP